MPTHAEYVEIAQRHAAAETVLDLEGTMATLDADGVSYEFQPIGVRLEGRDRARRYYEWFFASFMPRVTHFELRSEWADDRGLAQEYSMWVRLDDGTVERFEVIGIIVFGRAALSGERIYAHPRLLEIMVGPVLAEAVPIGHDLPG